MNTRCSLPLRPLAVLFGVVGIAMVAGFLQAQKPAQSAAKSAPKSVPVATPAKAVSPKPAVAAPVAAAAAPAPAPEHEDSTNSLIQGELLYRHLGDADPFWPKPTGCDPKDPRCRDKSIVEAKGCKKFKLEEMVLTGVTDTNGLKVAMLSAENKPYFVKTGDQCYDAQVLDIDEKTTCVKWRQVIPQTENNIRPYKDVISCLKAQNNSTNGSKG